MSDDLDAELLALAGDDSDDDVESIEEPEQVQAKSPSQEPKPSVENAEEPAARRRGVAQKVRKRGRKKTTRRELEDELDDLRDDSPSPAASTGSGDMDHSDYDADAPASPESEGGSQFPLDGEFMSASDRDYILSLPEIEREQILAERAQEELKRKQDLELKKAFAASQAASKNKRKAGAADFDDDSPRKSSRPKVEKRSALDDYKKARQAKGSERTSRLHRSHDPRDDRRASSASDKDAEGDSEVEWAAPSTNNRRDRDEPAAELKDYDRCRVGRSNFAKVCFYPNFESVMKGCFCRVSIGMNRETGQNMYRMTQIKGFTEGKPYQLEGSNGKRFMINQYAIVTHGSAEKPWPFSACSDSKFTEAEFQRYKDTFEKEHSRLPRKSWLAQKLDDIHKFLQPQWDEETLQTKLARQETMHLKCSPWYIARRKREAIVKRLSEAEESNDSEEITRCKAELAAHDANNPDESESNTRLAELLKPSPIKAPGATMTQQERLAMLNQKNRERNIRLVRTALLEERRKLQRDREKAYETAKAKSDAEEKTRQAALLKPNDMKDLFGETSDISRAATPFSGISTPNRSSTPMNGAKKDIRARSGIGMIVAKKRAEEEDALAELDLGIDVEI